MEHTPPLPIITCSRHDYSVYFKAIFLARDMMKYDPITIAKDADLIEAAQIMVNHRISGLPVVESNSGTLAGIITKTDIVKGIASYSK